MCITIDTREMVFPEIWERFYIGPNLVFVDIGVARKEMPWLISEGQLVTLGQTGNRD